MFFVHAFVNGSDARERKSFHARAGKQRAQRDAAPFAVVRREIRFAVLARFVCAHTLSSVWASLRECPQAVHPAHLPLQEGIAPSFRVPSSAFASSRAGREGHCPLQCAQSAHPDGLPLIFLITAAAATAATTTTQSTITTMSTEVITCLIPYRQRRLPHPPRRFLAFWRHSPLRPPRPKRLPRGSPRRPPPRVSLWRHACG